MNKKGLLIALAALVLVVLAAIGLSSTQMSGRDEKAAERPKAAEREVAVLPKETSQICGSNATFARIKEVAFEEAFRLRNDDPTDLDTLAANAVVRMEDPVVQSADDGTGTTVCAGRLVLELPPGAERGFNGDRRLTADVEYSAQRAADGSGLVYQIEGADAVIQRLAAFRLNPAQAPIQPAEVDYADAGEAEPDPVAVIPPAPPASRATPEARPEPRPAPRATPSPRASASPRATPSPRPTRTPTPRPTREARAEQPERATPRQTSRPSFNCRYARTRGEIMVCESSRLAAKDRAMSSEFYQALANSSPPVRRELRRSRDRFLAYRDRCRDEACVAEAYDGRVQEIRDIVELAPQE